jgi:hypothetical protein
MSIPNPALVKPPLKRSGVEDLSSYALGKKKPVEDSRTLKLGNYLDNTSLPDIPEKFIWNSNVKEWGMMKNDQIGDCTIAAAGHLIMGWNNDTGVNVQSQSDIKISDNSNKISLYLAYGFLGTAIVFMGMYLLTFKKDKK